MAKVKRGKNIFIKIVDASIEYYLREPSFAGSTAAVLRQWGVTDTWFRTYVSGGVIWLQRTNYLYDDTGFNWLSPTCTIVYEEIMGNLDYLTYIAVAAVASIVINTLSASMCKRKRKTTPKKAEKEKYRLEKKKRNATIYIERIRNTKI